MAVASGDTRQLNQAYSQTKPVVNAQGNSLMKSTPDAMGMVNNNFGSQAQGVSAGMDSDKNWIAAGAVTAAGAQVLGNVLGAAGDLSRAPTTGGQGSAGGQGQGTNQQPADPKTPTNAQTPAEQAEKTRKEKQAKAAEVATGEQNGSAGNNNRAGAQTRERLNSARASRRTQR